MSAYIVDKAHIVYLISAAISRRLSSHPGCNFSYYFAGQRHEIPAGDYERAADVANMLWRENIKSVSARYPNESSASLPGPVNEDFNITAADITGILTPEPAQIFKSIDCYSYQSCEHDGWKTSEAYAFCDSLRDSACRAVAGYDDAEWGAPKPASKPRRVA